MLVQHQRFVQSCEEVGAFSHRPIAFLYNDDRSTSVGMIEWGQYVSVSDNVIARVFNSYTASLQFLVFSQHL